MLPQSGAVLGIDVGWSLQSRSSAVCGLEWDERTIDWTIRRFTAHSQDRHDTIHAVIAGRHFLAAAFDGPLRGDLGAIDHYRAAERSLSVRSLRDAIGKLAQSNSGNGRLLNAATNACAQVVLDAGVVSPASHTHAIHDRAIVEAFPNSFLGLLLDDPAPYKGGRGQRSDRYFKALTEDGNLDALLAHHLPGRVPRQSFVSVTNHDDRAALVCALTALGVAGNDYLAVGDVDGWIIMPPTSLVAPWARPLVAHWND